MNVSTAAFMLTKLIIRAARISVKTAKPRTAIRPHYRVREPAGSNIVGLANEQLEDQRDHIYCLVQQL